jgi:hypothetical protein
VTVAIVGATGWTGGLVARHVAARGLDMVLLGRRSAALAAIASEIPNAKWRVAETGAALRDALDGANVVINCAGPSDDVGIAVVDAAIAARVDYLDVSGEETFVRRVYGTRDAQAHAAGIVVAPAFAGKGALGDWCASIVSAELALGGIGPATDVAIAYAHSSATFLRPSRGSSLAAAGQQFLRLRDRVRAAPTREFEFPPPFGLGRAIRVPGTEEVSLPRHASIREAATYVSIDPGRPTNRLWCELILGAAPLMPAIATWTMSPLGRRLLGVVPEPLRSSPGTFGAVIEARRCGEVRRMAVVTDGPYTVTAAIAALGADHLANRRPSGASGVLAPTQLLDPGWALARLQEAGALHCVRA